MTMTIFGALSIGAFGTPVDTPLQMLVARCNYKVYRKRYAHVASDEIPCSILIDYVSYDIIGQNRKGELLCIERASEWLERIRKKTARGKRTAARKAGGAKCGHLQQSRKR